MTQEQFLDRIEGCVNDYEAAIFQKAEVCNELLGLFIEAIEPSVKTREYFRLFIFRVHSMREQQKKYDSGDYNARVFAKRHENIVDNAITKLVIELGYNIGEITKQYQQGKLL